VRSCLWLVLVLDIRFIRDIWGNYGIRDRALVAGIVMKDRVLVAGIVVMMFRHLARSLLVSFFFLTWGVCQETKGLLADLKAKRMSR
jgi:hypothetical protein